MCKHDSYSDSAAIKGRQQLLRSTTSHLLRCGLRSKRILDTPLIERFQANWPGLVGCPKVSDRLRPANGECEMGRKAIWTIAHRGASGHAPENTMAAFRRAVELGARFIETDLQITRDARVIAIHDFTLDRTTSGKGQVHLLTLEQIRALDAGAWFDDHGPGAFYGERVPALE